MFKNEEVEKTKKTITIKMVLDGKERVFEHECDGFILFLSQGDKIIQHTKCKGSLMVEAVKKIMTEYPTAVELALVELEEGV